MQVNGDGVFTYASCAWFSEALNLLATSGAYGVAVDVWVRGCYRAMLLTPTIKLALNIRRTNQLRLCPPQWGAVEREPRHYTWAGYRQLLDLVRRMGLKMQASQ
jgi:hypothetical protein